jgi:hypothetical protein
MPARFPNTIGLTKTPVIKSGDDAMTRLRNTQQVAELLWQI